MADFRYQLNSAPGSHGDGSGMVTHDINAQSSIDAGVTWQIVAGRHKTFNIPADEMEEVNDMPDSTDPQRQAKIAAYKDALVANLNTQNVPISGWSAAQMQAFLDANEAAQSEADLADTFITVTLGLTYPVAFTI